MKIKQKKITTSEKVALIIKHEPEAARNYKLLLTLYWTIFDKIDIPKEVFSQILEKGTEPETISRSKRKVIETNIVERINSIKARLKNI